MSECKLERRSSSTFPMHQRVHRLRRPRHMHAISHAVFSGTFCSTFPVFSSISLFILSGQNYQEAGISLCSGLKLIRQHVFSESMTAELVDTLKSLGLGRSITICGHTSFRAVYPQTLGKSFCSIVVFDDLLFYLNWIEVKPPRNSANG